MVAYDRNARRRRRQPEAAVEIGRIVRAAVEGDIADPSLAVMRQHVGRFPQAQLGQPHRETGAGFIH